MSIDSEDIPELFQVLKIEGPDSVFPDRLEGDELPPNWADDIAGTQSIGDRWLSEKRSLLLEVPACLSLRPGTYL